MAQLVDFEQDPDAPPGAGVFHFDSGAKQYAYEPDLAAKATQLKQQVQGFDDANRLAKNDAPKGGNPFSRSMADLQGAGARIGDQNRGAMGIDPPVEAVPPASIARDNYVGNAPAPADQPGARGVLAAPPLPPEAPPPMAPGDLAAQAREAMGQRAAEDILRGTKRVRVAGTPGVDPHRMIEQGVMVPTGSTAVTESGAPYDPAQARERSAVAKEVRDANLAGMDLERQQTENQLQSQRALAPKLAEAAANAEQRHNTMQANYRAERSRLQQDLDHYEKTAHINPDRYFEDRGLFATIGLAIAQGMGAYASTKTGAPNFAFEMVQKAIDRDIAAQRDQIESGRVSRRNQLARFMDDYGYDMQQSEAALRIAMQKSADMQAQMFANESKLPHYQVEARKYNAMALQEIIKQEQNLYNASIGKQTRTQQQAFVQPKAATGGGYIEKELTPQELEARAKLLPKQTGQDVQDLDPKDRLKLVETYGEKKADFASLRATYEDLAQSYGYKVDWKRKTLVNPKTGEVVNPDDSALFGKNPNVPGVGYKDDLIHRQEAHRVQEARAKAAAVTGKALSGASVSPQQAEFIQSYLLGDDDAGALRGLQRAIGDMGQVENDTEAAYSEETRAEYDRRRRGISRSNKTAPEPVKVSDY